MKHVYLASRSPRTSAQSASTTTSRWNMTWHRPLKFTKGIDLDFSDDLTLPTRSMLTSLRRSKRKLFAGLQKSELKHTANIQSSFLILLSSRPPTQDTRIIKTAPILQDPNEQKLRNQHRHRAKQHQIYKTLQCMALAHRLTLGVTDLLFLLASTWPAAPSTTSHRPSARALQM